MLNVEPTKRASLAEVMTHPWMTKGFHGPLENHLPYREPLQLPLDESIIEKMHGFDFGSPDYIKRQLTSVLSTEEYQRAVKLAARRPQASEGDRKKASVFDFYQRRKSNTSKDTLSPPSSEAIHLGEDPINAFNPLISIYYLVREKQEREKVEANPGAFSMPQSPGEKPLQLPDLPPPEPAFTNTGAFEMVGEAPTGGRTRPRARTHGEDDASNTMRLPPQQPSQTPAIRVPQAEATPKKESTAVGLLRRFSTRRGRDSTRQGDKEKEALSKAPLVSQIPAVQESTLAPPRNSLSIRKARDTPPSAYRDVAAKHPDLLAPPTASTESTGGRLKGLGRSTSVNSGDLRRRWSTKRGASESLSTTKPVSSDSEKVSLIDVSKQQQQSINDASSDDSRQASAPKRLSSSRARSMGHSRRGSTNQRAGIANGIDAEVPEETDAELAEAEDESREPFTRPNPSQETMKPVYLKGLFSVSTTSNKPLSFIRLDIIRVLKQLGVEYREMKGGFACRHLPSVDLNKVVDEPDDADRNADRQRGMRQSSQHKRKISFAGLRDRNDRDDANGLDSPSSSRPPLTPRTPSRKLRMADASNYTTDEEGASDSDSRTLGFKPISKRLSTQISRGSNAPTSDPVPLSPRPLADDAIPRATDGPSFAARPGGETTTHVQSETSRSLVLRFDLLVVKVPFLNLHGLQFKRIDGNVWSYKQMADTILGLLKL